MKEIATKYKVNIWDISNWKNSSHYKDYLKIKNKKDKNYIKNSEQKPANYSTESININRNKSTINETKKDMEFHNNTSSLTELEIQKIKNQLLMDIIKEISGSNLKKTP